jgi:hypothetical protein
MTHVEIREYISAGICPFCERGPFRSLAHHVNPTHGVDKYQLRDMAGYTMDQPLCSEEVSERCRRDIAVCGLWTGDEAMREARDKKSKYRHTEQGLRNHRSISSKNLKAWQAANPDAHRAAAVAGGKKGAALRWSKGATS